MAANWVTDLREIETEFGYCAVGGQRELLCSTGDLIKGLNMRTD